MNKEKMGSFLIELRKEKNLTQNDLAEIFIVSPQAISKWESGSSIPDIDMLEKISKFYNVSIEEVINGERKQIDDKQKTTSSLLQNKDNKLNLTKDLFSFIFSMFFLVLFVALYFLNIYSVPVYISGIGYMQIELTGYKLLFETNGTLPTLLWIFTILMNASYLINIGLWIAQNKKGYYLTRLILSSLTTIFALVIYLYCSNEQPILFNNAYYSSVMHESFIIILALYLVYYILILTLPFTNHKHFFIKTTKNK